MGAVALLSSYQGVCSGAGAARKHELDDNMVCGWQQYFGLFLEVEGVDLLQFAFLATA